MFTKFEIDMYVLSRACIPRAFRLEAIMKDWSFPVMFDRKGSSAKPVLQTPSQAPSFDEA